MTTRSTGESLSTVLYWWAIRLTFQIRYASRPYERRVNILQKVGPMSNLLVADRLVANVVE